MEGFAIGLAIAALIVSLLCGGIVAVLAYFLFRVNRQVAEHKISSDKEASYLAVSATGLAQRIKALEDEAKNGIQTGMYSPVRDKVTGKVEMKMIQDFSELEDLSYDEIMKRARELADGKV